MSRPRTVINIDLLFARCHAAYLDYEYRRDWIEYGKYCAYRNIITELGLTKQYLKTYEGGADNA